MSATENINTEQARKRNLRPFWILLLVTGLPYLGSWIYFANRDILPMPETSNRGQLIDPVVPLQAPVLKDIEGKSFDLNELQGRWTLISLAGSDCQADCQRNLYLLRQTRLAMGEDRIRVNRLFFLSDTESLPVIREQLGEYQGTRVAVGPADALQQIQAALGADGRNARDGVFILDPMGNLVMFYPAGYEPKDLVKDLQRLLKVSRVG